MERSGFSPRGRHARRSACGSLRSSCPAGSPRTGRSSRGCRYPATDAGQVAGDASIPLSAIRAADDPRPSLTNRVTAFAARSNWSAGTRYWTMRALGMRRSSTGRVLAGRATSARLILSKQLNFRVPTVECPLKTGAQITLSSLDVTIFPSPAVVIVVDPLTRPRGLGL